MDVVGIDWSGAKDAGRRAWVCRARGSGPRLHICDVYRVADVTGDTVEDLIAHIDSEVVKPPGQRWIGLDFPFSIVRRLAQELGYTDWWNLVMSWEALFPDAERFARLCTHTCRRLTRRAEAKREIERKVRAPMPPWNLRLFRQTYHGIRLLRRVVDKKRAAILPWVRLDGHNVRLFDICPAATLASIDEPPRGYKGRDIGHARRRRYLLAKMKKAWKVSVPSDVVRAIVRDKGGDALDSVLAAVSAYHHVARLDAAAHAKVRKSFDQLEGYIYAQFPWQET